MSYIGLHFGIFIYLHLSARKVEQTVVYEWIMLQKSDPWQASSTAGSKPLRNYQRLAVSMVPEIKAHNSRFVFPSFRILFQGHRLTRIEVQRRYGGSSGAARVLELGPLNGTELIWSRRQRRARILSAWTLQSGEHELKLNGQSKETIFGRWSRPLFSRSNQKSIHASGRAHDKLENIVYW